MLLVTSHIINFDTVNSFDIAGYEERTHALNLIIFVQGTNLISLRARTSPSCKPRSPLLEAFRFSHLYCFGYNL